MASIKDFESLENTFKELEANSDLQPDDKAQKILATLYLTGNAVIDNASHCKVSDMLVSKGAFDMFVFALTKRKYSTTEKKPCRWASPDTEASIQSLERIMRESIVRAMENNCGLSSRR
jgi:hypothetical protein